MRKPRDRRYDTARWRLLRARVVARDGYRCTTPGCTTDTSKPRSLHVDHVIEVSDGGLFWDMANLRTLCWLHHGAKTRLVMANRAGAVDDEVRRPGFLTAAEYAAIRPSRDW
jgi:5-methylcytosine-specific restriction endonuclease McrA